MELKIKKDDVNKLNKIKKDIDELKINLINSHHFNYFISYFSIQLKELITKFHVELINEKDVEFSSFIQLNAFFKKGYFAKFSNKHFVDFFVYKVMSLTSVSNIKNIDFNKFVKFLSKEFSEHYCYLFTNLNFFEIEKTKEIIKNKHVGKHEFDSYYTFDYKINYFKSLISEKINSDLKTNTSFNESIHFVMNSLILINENLQSSIQLKKQYESFINYYKVNIPDIKNAKQLKIINTIETTTNLTKITNTPNFNKLLFSTIQRIYNNYTSSHFEFLEKIRQKKIYDLIGRETIKNISYLKTANINIADNVNYVQSIEKYNDEFDLFMKESEKFFYPSYAKIGFSGSNQLLYFKNNLKKQILNNFIYQKGITKSGWKFLSNQNKNYILRFIRKINLGIFCSNNKLKDAWLRSDTLSRLVHNEYIYFIAEELIKKSVENYHGPVKYFNPFPNSKRIVMFDQKTFSIIQEEFIKFIDNFKDKQSSKDNLNLSELKAYLQIVFYFTNHKDYSEVFKKEYSHLFKLFSKFKLTDISCQKIESFNLLNIEDKINHYSVHWNENKNNNGFSLVNFGIYFNVNEHSAPIIYNEISNYIDDINKFIKNSFISEAEHYKNKKISPNSSIFIAYQVYYETLFNLKLSDINTAICEIKDYLKSLLNNKNNNYLLNKEDVLEYIKLNAGKKSFYGAIFEPEFVKTLTPENIEFGYEDLYGEEVEETAPEAQYHYTMVCGEKDYMLSLNEKPFLLSTVGNGLKKIINRDVKSLDHLLLLSDRWHQEQNNVKIANEEKLVFKDFEHEKFGLSLKEHIIYFNSMEMRYINNSISLYEEGKKMHHCVYDYKNDCFLNKYLVFTIYKNSLFDRATLGINYNKFRDKGKRYTFSQIYSFSNRNVSQRQKDLAMDFISHLNKNDE